MVKAPENDKDQQPRIRQQKLPLSWNENLHEDESADSDAAPGEKLAVAGRELRNHPEEEQRTEMAGGDADNTLDAEVSNPAVADQPEAVENSMNARQEMHGEAETGPVEPEEGGHVVELGEIVMSLGQILQEARGNANLTVAQVAQKTKIPKGFIEAVELDRYESLPSPIYARSHIAQLCREYGIEEAQVLREYEKVLAAQQRRGQSGRLLVTSHPTESGSKVEYQLDNIDEAGTGKGVNLTGILVGAVMLGLVLLVLIALGVQHHRYRQSRDAAVESSAVTVTAEGDGMEAGIDLEQFAIPQQLPLQELPVPVR